MPTKAGVGVSHHRNPKVAGKEAAEKALQAGGVTKPDFLFLFSTVGYPQQAVLDSVRAAAGRAPVCGCSGEGVIAQGIADESNFSVAVLAIQSDEMRFVHGLATGLKADSAAVGREVGKAAKPHLGQDTAALFVLGDGLAINFDAFQRGVQEVIGAKRNLPMFGGASADNWAFKQTYQYHDDRVASDGVAWALLSGKAAVVSHVNHGCVPIGGKRTVTRWEKNVIHEIDGRPALEVLKEYLLPEEIDNWDKAVISLCLGFRTPASLAGYDDYMIRFIPGKDDATGSITIQTEIPAGGDVWMTRRDPDRMAAGVKSVGQAVASRGGKRAPKLVFQFDCCGRGKAILPEPLKLQLVRDLQQAVGPNAPWIGFYTLGEIGPVGGSNCFHNYTVVLMALY